MEVNIATRAAILIMGGAGRDRGWDELRAKSTKAPSTFCCEMRFQSRQPSTLMLALTFNPFKGGGGWDGVSMAHGSQRKTQTESAFLLLFFVFLSWSGMLCVMHVKRRHGGGRRGGEGEEEETGGGYIEDSTYF